MSYSSKYSQSIQWWNDLPFMHPSVFQLYPIQSVVGEIKILQISHALTLSINQYLATILDQDNIIMKYIFLNNNCYYISYKREKKYITRDRKFS